jgi:hypothetical protein
MRCGLILSSLPLSTIAYQRVCWGGGLIHYQSTAADALQRSLRARFQVRLMPSVDMTSDVKSRQRLFLGLHDIF